MIRVTRISDGTCGSTKSRIHMRMAGVAEPTDTLLPRDVSTYTNRDHMKKKKKLADFHTFFLVDLSFVQKL